MKQQQLNPEIAAAIRSIALVAAEKGWTPEMLWEPRFWNITERGNRPGLAAVMWPEDRVIEVTEDYIAIQRASGVVHRFYHPDRPHPWIVKNERGE